MSDDQKPAAGKGSEKPGRKGPGLSMKVSQKGAVSVYGLGRFPVTLYKEQWLKLLEMGDDIRKFLGANEAQLKAKGEARAEATDAAAGTATAAPGSGDTSKKEPESV